MRDELSFDIVVKIERLKAVLACLLLVGAAVLIKMADGLSVEMVIWLFGKSYKEM